MKLIDKHFQNSNKTFNLFKKSLKILFVCFFTFFVATFSFSQSKNSQKNEKNLKEFSKIYSIESDFTVERQSKAADKPLESNGKFFYQSADKLRWEYLTPSKSGFLIDGSKTFFWIEKKGNLDIKDISDNSRAKEMVGNILAFISMDINEIEKKYEIRQNDLDLIIEPKDNSKKSRIKNIKIVINKNAPTIKEIEILSQKNLKTLIKFSNTKTNQKLPENAFKI